METNIYPNVNSQPLLGYNEENNNNRPDKQRRGRRCFKWIRILVFLAILVLLSLILVVVGSISSKMADNQDALLDKINQQLNQMTLSSTNNYVVPNLPPRTYQYTRGTCWDFATIGAVEHQYKLQGIKNGWLKQNQYVRFSEQAYGNQIISLCSKNQARCLLPGDHVAFNSTDGGESTLLWAFQNELANKLLPDSVCPYIQDRDDSSCPGIDAAIASNPVQFKLKGFSTLYSVDSIKNAILTKGYAMPFSFPVHTVSFYMSCSDPHVSSSLACTSTDLNQYTPCPTDASFGSDRCVKHVAPMYNMNGEFRMHHALDAEAGHAVLLVGFTDSYRSKDGTKGGFIIRNSWKDGLYSFDEFKHMISRGSHSYAYFTQQISEAAERMLCPNSYYPKSWAMCGNGAYDSPISMMNDCLSSSVQTTAAAEYQPINLICANNTGTAGICDIADENRYFLLNMTSYGDDFSIACFLQIDAETQIPTDFCLPPLLVDEIATIFTPIASEIRENDDDYCGYYFYPYTVWEYGKETFDSAFVNDYELDFQTQSFYAAKAQTNAGLSYDFLQKSTLTQKALPNIVNPFPIAPQ